jgi:hypothetical protein
VKTRLLALAVMLGVVGARPPPGRRPGAPRRALFVNPSGPGGGGVEVATYADLIFSPELVSRFDIVGLDPRSIVGGPKETTPTAATDGSTPRRPTLHRQRTTRAAGPTRKTRLANHRG